MNIQSETQNEKPPSGDTSHRIPRRVWVAACLAVVGALMIAVVAIVNEGGGSPVQIWNLGAPSFCIAAMIAVVCYAIVRHR